MSAKFTILFFIVSFLGFSQGGFRTRYYPLNGITSVTKDIFETTPGKYIAGGIVVDTINGFQVNRLTILGLDSVGNVLWTKKYGNSKFEYLNNPYIFRFFYKQDNFIYTACCVEDSNNKYVGVLIKFDFNGDTIWQKIYRDSMDVMPQMVTGSVDGGFLITGFFQDWNGGGRPCLLIKTDAFGNELWRKKINKAGHNVSDGKAIIQDTATGKIVIVGYQYSGNPSQTKDHVLITDSLGNKLVQRSYYGANSGILSDLVQTKDKNIVAVGVAYKNQYIGTDQLKCSYIIKLNINSTQTSSPIWVNTNFDSPEITNAFTTIRELPNGELIVGGGIDTLSLVQNWALQRVSIFNQNGIHKRSTYYNYKTNSLSSSNYQAIVALNLTSDGGWVAGITQVNNPNPNPLFYVKYDSTGCDSTVAYCLNPVGVENFWVQDLKIKVYPNPSAGTFEIASESKLNGTLMVFDLYGRKILTKELSESKKIEFILEGYNNGIYFVEIRTKDSERTIYKEKLIKFN